MRKPGPLSQDVSDLLRSEREVEPMPLEMRQRVLTRARLAQRFSVPTRTGHTLSRNVVVGTLTLALGAAAASTFRHQLFAPSNSDTPPETHTTQDDPRPTTSAVPLPSPSPLPPSRVDGSAGNAAQLPAAAPVPPSSSQQSRTGARGDTNTEQLDRELVLLKRARSAVSAGDHSGALSALNEHTKRFPSGRLREEREALRVTALWNGGKRAEARRAAERFIKLFPRSVLAPQMAEKAKAGP